MLSFVLYFHSSRIDNLRQTLRFLFSRERIRKEVVLICNDETDEEFKGCRLINMGLRDYMKPVMCNLGVREAKGEVVALLDSDRILPEGYFAAALKALGRGDFLSCRRMLNLDAPYRDSDIFSDNFDYQEEFRSEGWELWQKNLFSGNTLFHRSDYLEAGGMDESFVGYGFADNDMTRNVLAKGFRARWYESTEIHLHHAREAMESGEVVGVERRREIMHGNMCRFLRKWRMKEYFRHCRCLA